MSAKQRYATLDGLRGVAAVVVLCYHTHVFPGSAAIAPHGYLAVDFFFMLSGFVIASAYQEKLEAGFTVADFVTQRVIRLYPVALVGILLGALRLVSQYLISPTDSEPAQWIALTLLLNVLILPVVSQTHFRGELFPTNGPVWSLFSELLVNLGWSIFVSLKSSIIVIVFLTMACGTILYATMHETALDDLGWNSKYPLEATCRVLFSFLLGAVIYRFRGVLPNLSKGPGIMLPALSMTALLLVLGMPWFEGGWDALAIFLFLPAILTLGVLCGREPDAAVRSFLGEISYPIYAVHFPVFLLLSGFRHSIFPSLNVSAVISIGVLSALLAAIALNHFDKWLRIHLSRKSTFAPSTGSRSERSARPCDETATAKPSRLGD
jgi:peptidoglycan/LPS O-acetylase OafA/YrhL